MSTNSNQFIAFEINGADDLEISENTIGGKMNGVLKSNSKINKLKISNNTILNTNETKVLLELINTLEPACDIPESIKNDILNEIKNLEEVQTAQEKITIFRKIANICENLVHFGASAVTITPSVNSLISQLPL